jgi:hypothetical protein
MQTSWVQPLVPQSIEPDKSLLARRLPKPFRDATTKERGISEGEELITICL